MQLLAGEVVLHIALNFEAHLPDRRALGAGIHAVNLNAVRDRGLRWRAYEDGPGPKASPRIWAYSRCIDWLSVSELFAG
jgi:hypothetical protein